MALFARRSTATSSPAREEVTYSTAPVRVAGGDGVTRLREEIQQLRAAKKSSPKSGTSS